MRHLSALWRRLLATSLLLLGGSLATPASAQPLGDRALALDRMTFSLAFDQTNLYIAFDMQDINLTSPTTRAGDPVQGDAVAVFFDRMPNRPFEERKSIYGHALRIDVSASGGIYYGIGGNEKNPTWLALEPLLEHKIQLHGTLNDPSDVDAGWSAELAIPWQRVGRNGPPLDEEWSYNVTRILRGDADARYSHSPDAVDDMNPSTWQPLIFRAGLPGFEAGGKYLVFATSPQNPVVVDGAITDGEWPLAQRIVMNPSANRLRPLPPLASEAIPTPQRPLPPGSTFRPRPLTPRAPRGAYQGDSLILANYRLDLLPTPGAPLWDRHGATLLAAHPLGGLTPDTAASRVGAHTDALSRAGAAGLDVLLVRWPVARAARDEWGLEALRSLVLAATSLSHTGRDVPLLAPRLDLSAGPGLQADLDLTQQAQSELVYGALFDFCQLVPPQFRAQLTDGPRGVVLVDLGDAPDPVRLSPDFLRYLEQRCLGDFGLDILWLGSALWARRGLPLDAVRTIDGGAPVYTNGAERVTIGVLRPGLDESRTGGQVVTRRGFEELSHSFDAILAAEPDWLLLDSWNDLRRGTEVMVTRERGADYERRAAILAAQFVNHREAPVVARVRRLEAPNRVVAGGPLRVAARVVNAGLRPWDASTGVRIAATWYGEGPRPLLDDNGQPVLDRTTGQPMMADPPANDQRYTSGPLSAASGAVSLAEIQLNAVDTAGEPLAPGRYRLRFSIIGGTTTRNEPVLGEDGEPQTDRRGRPVTREVQVPTVIATQGGGTLDLPIEVLAPEAAPAYAATVLSADLPSRLETGRLYPLTVTLRNDGAQPWPEGTTLGVRYEQVERIRPNVAPSRPRVLTPWQSAGDLPGPTAPGASASIRGKLPTGDAEGEPLPVDHDPGLLTRIHLALLDPSGQPLPATLPWFQAVQILDRDWGSGLVNLALADQLIAGSEATASVRMLNTAFESWEEGTAELVWSWYRLDGAPYELAAGRLPLAFALHSGQAVDQSFTVQAPVYSGPLELVVEVVHGGRVHSSAQPSTYLSEVARRVVDIAGGPIVPLNLEGSLNLAGAAPETGDLTGLGFDGRGRYLPAELLPPVIDGTADRLYPTAWLAAFDEPSAWPQVTFAYPPQASRDGTGLRGILQPTGQVVTTPVGRYRRAHLLAAAIDGDQQLELSALDSGGGLTRLPAITVPRWDAPPPAGVGVGIRLPYRLTVYGAEPLPAWLHHISLPLDPELPLAGLVLAAQEKVRVLAISLEPVERETPPTLAAGEAPPRPLGPAGP